MADRLRNPYGDGIIVTLDNLAFSNACTTRLTATACPKVDKLVKWVSHPFWVLEQRK
jgi:hypothetical protein